MRLTADDPERVTNFFSSLYGNCDVGNLEVRCIDLQERGKRSESAWFPVYPAGTGGADPFSYAQHQNEAGYDVFFGVNPRVNGGKEDESVLAGVAIWADIDNLGTPEAAEEALGELLKCQVRPDAAVYSGNGLHVYVTLKEPVDPASPAWGQYLYALKRYARMTGGDPQCVNPSRILRFPLSFSHKRGRQTLLWLPT